MTDGHATDEPGNILSEFNSVVSVSWVLGRSSSGTCCFAVGLDADVDTLKEIGDYFGQFDPDNFGRVVINCIRRIDMI
tara:strand:- start:198 stop:431 length:234 start_codon:yes stop_codon:yes gene_type:complete